MGPSPKTPHHTSSHPAPPARQHSQGGLDHAPAQAQHQVECGLLAPSAAGRPQRAASARRGVRSSDSGVQDPSEERGRVSNMRALEAQFGAISSGCTAWRPWKLNFYTCIGSNNLLPSRGLFCTHPRTGFTEHPHGNHGFTPHMYGCPVAFPCLTLWKGPHLDRTHMDFMTLYNISPKPKKSHQHLQEPTYLRGLCVTLGENPQSFWML